MADLVAITSCEEQAFDLAQQDCGESAGFARDVLASQVRRGLVQLICAKADVLGYLSYSISATHIFIDALAILPTHHRMGMGGRLLRFAEDEAVRLGLETVELYADGSMIGNCAFYLRCGYHESGRCAEPDFLRVFYSKTVGAANGRPACVPC